MIVRLWIDDTEMNNFLKDFKSEAFILKKNLEFFLGLISIGAGIYAFCWKMFGARMATAFMLLGGYLIVRRICSILIHSTSEKIPGFKSETYNKHTRKIAKVTVRLCLGILVLALFYDFYTPGRAKAALKQNIGVIISKFSIDESFDGFSYKVTNLLRSKLNGTDSIDIVQEKSFLDIGPASYIDTVKDIFHRNEYKRGLLVFGCRNQELNLFDCNIYINGMNSIKVSKPNADTSRSDAYVLYIQNPDLVNFSIENQAQDLAGFILALLQYNAHDYVKSLGSLGGVNSSCNNTGKLSSYCYLFMGNCYMTQNNYTNAILSYKQGMERDSTNPYLNYNAGIALLILKDTLNAYASFKQANSLDPEMKLPEILRHINSSNNDLSSSDNSGNGNYSAASLFQQSSAYDSLQNVDSLNPEIFPLWYHVIKKSKEGKYGATPSCCPKDTIVDFIYDSIFYKKIVYSPYFIVRSNGKYGVLDFNGATIIKPEERTYFDAVKRVYKCVH
jgi:tetratricopeptide (TPR) repeat protein